MGRERAVPHIKSYARCGPRHHSAADMINLLGCVAKVLQHPWQPQETKGAPHPRLSSILCTLSSFSSPCGSCTMLKAKHQALPWLVRLQARNLHKMHSYPTCLPHSGKQRSQ